MGWRLKALAVLFGLMLVPFAWPLSAILFLYAASGLIARGLRSRAQVTAATPSLEGARTVPAVSFKGRVGHPVRRVTGVVFLGLSAVALTHGGTFSPLFFGGIGAVLLLWGTPLFGLGGLGSLRAVEESVLLRGVVDPFHWLGVAEVKLATRQVGRALGGIDETVIVSLADEGPSVFIVLRSTSIGFRRAEESISARLQELARISAPLGAYLLPLDSSEALDLFRLPRKPVKLDSRSWPSALSTTDYDLLTVEARRGGFVHSVGAYKRSGQAERANAAVPPARQALSRPSLLWEVFQDLGRKVEWPKPDGYTTFLASFSATEGEVIGTRVSEAGSSANPQEVLVQSLGTPAVKMSRAQLRAVARAYP